MDIDRYRACHIPGVRLSRGSIPLILKTVTGTERMDLEQEPVCSVDEALHEALIPSELQPPKGAHREYCCQMSWKPKSASMRKTDLLQQIKQLQHFQMRSFEI